MRANSAPQRITPVVLVLALLAFGVAATALAFVPHEPRLWSASVALVILGGITPMIYAVSIRIMPVFSRRSWQRPRLLEVGVACGVAGGWLVFAGRAFSAQEIELTGHLAALAAGIGFVVSIILLFRSAITAKVAPPLPYPEHVVVDRVGIQFTRIAGVWLLAGLSIGVLLELWTPSRGRWELVWAHSLLLGWFLMMAFGVSYHVLSRWTGERWRSHRRVRAHLLVTSISVPLMVVALAADIDRLFAVAGTTQALAVGLFVWNAFPLVRRLPGASRLALLCASGFLVLGVSIGASAAIDPVSHARLRFSHAEINLLGWAGLLILGMGYYLFPRFAGRPLPWPRLAPVQIAAHASGVALSAVAWWWYLAVDTAAEPLMTAGALVVAGSFFAFAGVTALTFRRAGQGVTQMIRVEPRRSSCAVRPVDLGKSR